MRSIYVLLTGLMIITLMSANPLAAEDAPACRFDMVKSGLFESVAKSKRGYEISLRRGEEVFTITVDPGQPFYAEAERYMTEADPADSQRKLAFLFQSNQLCDFVRVSEDLVYLEDYNLRDGKYILSVCSDESGNCYSLRISPENGLFERAEKFLPDLILQLLEVTFTAEREFLSARVRK